jgi:hypothetical protein
MKRFLALTLITFACQTQAQSTTPAAAPAATVSSPAKKALVDKVLKLQQGDIEALSRNLTQEPAARMLQEANRVLQTQVPQEQREVTGKTIEAAARKYVDEAVPLVRDKAIKLAPSTLGAALEEKFTEDELKVFVNWLESPVYRKYQQVAPEIQRNFVQKLVAEARPSIDPKLKTLEESVRNALASATSSGGAPANSAKPTPAKPASK